jgi:hypothetical protein
MSCNYVSISNFGASAGMSEQNDPLTYCLSSGLQSGFQHTLGTTLLGPDSSQCQIYMAQYCAKNFDGVCEYAINDNNRSYPNAIGNCYGGNLFSNIGSGLGNPLTKGQVLLRNTAAERFVVAMSGNCAKAYQPFDPTVAFSPMIYKWEPKSKPCDNQNTCHGNACTPVYDVDAKTIDQDPVMDKILPQAFIAIDILTNIYNNRVRNSTLSELNNTKIGQFFNSPQFQNFVKNN